VRQKFLIFERIPGGPIFSFKRFYILIFFLTIMFIKKIFENKIDDSVHKQFVRFGKGVYPGRAVVKITRQPEKIKIGTSFEMANDIVEFCSQISNSLKCSGLIFSKEKLELSGEKKKSGLLAYDINQDLTSDQIKKILEKCYITLLDIESPGISLKSKKKIPKPGKAGDSKIDDKFCQLELNTKFWPQVKSEFAFDLPEFKKALTVHTYTITDIIMPKGEKDFEKIRILAKRKGKIIRKITIDKQETLKEKGFEA